MSRRGTSLKRNKTVNTDINMEEKKAQLAPEVEMVASNLQDIIRLMAEQISKNTEDTRKKIKDNNKALSKYMEENNDK